ncbi:hypothetical protein IWW50_002890 [Coemansia erecta]|nr:hypothetical protein IWW50_002890 [Coemansia erecta]
MAPQLKVDTMPRAALVTTASASKLKAADVFGLLSPPDSPILHTKATGTQQQTKTTDAVEVTAEMKARATRLSIPAPVPWTQFKQLVDAENLEPLGRSFAMQVTYEQHIIQMARQYGSVANYLIDHALADLIAETKAPGFDPKSALAASDFVFRANDFPYYLGDGVEHWVMWCKKKLQPGYAASAAAVEAIESRFGHSAEWRYFVNPVRRQSVPQLSHAHVFIKRTLDITHN